MNRLHTYLILIIIASAAVGCGEEDVVTEQKESSKELEVSTKYSTLKAEIKDEKIGAEVPSWLINLYPDTIIFDSINGDESQSIIRFSELNDSVSYCIYELSNGVCLNYYLVVFIDDIETNNLIVEEGCDHDQSVPNFSWSEYEILSTGKIETTEYFEFVPDSLLDENGQIEEGKSYDDYDLKYDTTYTIYELLETGKIKIIKEKNSL